MFMQHISMCLIADSADRGERQDRSQSGQDETQIRQPATEEEEANVVLLPQLWHWQALLSHLWS